MRRWPVNAWSQYSDVPVANNTVMDLVALPGGGLLFAAADPAWGVLNAAGQIQSRQDGAIADLRGPDQLRLSADGRRVRFGYQWPGQDARSFDLVSRSLGADDSALSAARTAAPGLDIKNWQDRTDPTLNGQPLKLEQYEHSRSLAIAPDAERFVLGTEWSLRLFDRAGRELWQQPVPGVAWAVNISADGRFVVVGYGDGTIRWHRLSNGEEVLALFPHADRQRWIAWTPEGFYATSGPDAEELVGYHLNRGKEREGEFISARQLREHFYQPGLISQRLDANGDALVAEAVQKLGDVRELLAGAKAPAPVVELLSDAQITTAGDVPVKVRIKDQGGGIGRLIYRIDGIEFEGRMVGIAADGTDSRTFTLPPQQGQREITVSATNARGVESLPVRIVAQVQPRPSAAPSLHVLAIGVSLYRDKELQKGVRFAARDADTMGQLFREQGARLYQSVNVRVLSDAQATGDAIRTALTELASRIAAQDVFVLYLAGHGASFDRDYHFIPWDAVYTSTAALRQRSLTHEHFRGLLAKIPATKTVVLLDTCSAGGFGRQDGRNIGEKDAIDRLSRLTGRAMIAATADDKMAIEGEGGHGAFTFALLEGLRGKADRNGNGTVEVHELADYVEERLPEITRKWGYEQFPFSATEGHFLYAGPEAMTAPLKVFFSYAHADEAHRETLANHLSALEDEGLIVVWHDRKITGGREWAGAIDDALRSADIVLLLISADFLASDYCNDVELTEAIRRHDAAQARVVPVILRSCDWEHSRFARFNALPPDGVPVVEAEHPDQRFVAVARGLRAIVAELTSPDSATTTQNPTRSDASPATSPAPGAEAPSADAGARHAPSAGDAAAPAPKPRRLTIGKISLFGIELGGPFEIPLPQLGAKPLLLGLGHPRAAHCCWRRHVFLRPPQPTHPGARCHAHGAL